MLRFTAFVAALGLCAAFASADQLLPVSKGSLYDHAPEDGIVDEVSTSMWVYHSSQGDRRAIAEYDVDFFTGATLTEARISGRLSVNNSLPSGDRIFNVLLYAGDGSMQNDDFDRPGSVVGTFSYDPPNVSSVDFDFDVSSVAQTLLDGGATYLGFRFEQTNEGAPNVISSSNPVILTIVPEPATATLLAGLSLLTLRRRR